MLVDSLARLHRLEEFGITFDDVIPLAFKYANENSISSHEENKKLCWQFLPNEPSCVSEDDMWGYHSLDVMYRDSKRENFISNSEEIEKDFAALIEELSLIYSETFYLISLEKSTDVRVLDVNEVATCLRYWK